MSEREGEQLPGRTGRNVVQRLLAAGARNPARLARKRRLVPLVAVLVLAGCGGSSKHVQFKVPTGYTLTGYTVPRDVSSANFPGLIRRAVVYYRGLGSGRSQRIVRFR